MSTADTQHSTSNSSTRRRRTHSPDPYTAAHLAQYDPSCGCVDCDRIRRPSTHTHLPIPLTLSLIEIPRTSPLPGHFSLHASSTAHTQHHEITTFNPHNLPVAGLPSRRASLRLTNRTQRLRRVSADPADGTYISHARNMRHLACLPADWQAAYLPYVHACVTDEQEFRLVCSAIRRFCAHRRRENIAGMQAAVGVHEGVLREMDGIRRRLEVCITEEYEHVRDADDVLTALVDAASFRELRELVRRVGGFGRDVEGMIREGRGAERSAVGLVRAVERARGEVMRDDVVWRRVRGWRQDERMGEGERWGLESRNWDIE